jgi:zinc transport system substrate-binding protein
MEGPKMKAPLFAALAALTIAPLAPAAVAAPRVVADIPPVQSLVARVMQGVGEPVLILPPGASPHSHAMRPSEAAAMQEAEILFWIGPELTPWLERAVANLAGDATAVALIDLPGTVRLEVREGARFEAHDHGDDDHGHDHAKKDDHGHDHGHDHAKKDDHGHDHGHDHDDHGRADPHAWLDPANAAVWLDAIAAELSKRDPANAGAYFANAAAAKAELKAVEAEIAAALAPLKGKPFIVFHDAYHYFEARFGIEAVGAISVSDADDPGAARLAEIRAVVRDTDAVCIFSEPQFPPRLAEMVAEGSDARIGLLDPVGAGLEPGPGLYPQLLRAMAAGLKDCLG